MASNGRTCCNCVKSKCVKLYCTCFSKGLKCEDCTCKNCRNNDDFEEERMRAVSLVLKRDPNAFKEKVVAKNGKTLRLEKGCNCKITNCVKRYCPCVHAGVICTERCFCKNCENALKTEIEEIMPVVKMETNVEQEEKEKIEIISNEDLRKEADYYIQNIIEQIAQQDLNKNIITYDEKLPDVLMEEDDKDTLDILNAKKFVMNVATHLKDESLIDSIVSCMLKTAETGEIIGLREDVLQQNILLEFGAHLKELIEQEKSWKQKISSIDYYDKI